MTARADERQLGARRTTAAQRRVEPRDDGGRHLVRRQVLRHYRDVEPRDVRAKIELRRAAVHRQRELEVRVQRRGRRDHGEVVADDPHCVLAGAPHDDATHLFRLEHAAEHLRPIEHRAFTRSSRRPVRESVRSWPVSPSRRASPGTFDAEPSEIGGCRIVDARVAVARKCDVDGA